MEFSGDLEVPDENLDSVNKTYYKQQIQAQNEKNRLEENKDHDLVNFDSEELESSNGR